MSDLTACSWDFMIVDATFLLRGSPHSPWASIFFLIFLFLAACNVGCLTYCLLSASMGLGMRISSKEGFSSSLSNDWSMFHFKCILLGVLSLRVAIVDACDLLPSRIWPFGLDWPRVWCLLLDCLESWSLNWARSWDISSLYCFTEKSYLALESFKLSLLNYLKDCKGVYSGSY